MWHEIGNVEDPTLPPEDARYVVAKTHLHLTETGERGFSGQLDPKFILKGDVRFIDMEAPGAVCELCMSGDMIPPEKRFKHSKYRPV